MVQRSRIRLLAGAVASIALPGLWGCRDPLYEGPAPGPGYPPYYYDYYYYPHVDVYFHLYTGWYYYRDSGRWLRVRRLPPRIYLNPGYRRVLRIPEREPWRRHQEHRRRYPPPAPPRDPGSRRAPRSGSARPRPAPPVTVDRRRERARDRDEREHNIRRYNEFQKRGRSPRKR